MADFADVVRRYMSERGMSLRGLAAAAHYDPGLLSKVLRGQRPHSAYLAGQLDAVLGAGGEIIAAARQSPPRPPGRPAGRRKVSGAVEALQAVMGGEPDGGTDLAADGLAELVPHYAREVTVSPSPAVYGELLSARSFAGTLQRRGAPSARSGLAVTAGWLSSLLAISAADLGDHAAAIVWCGDAARRGRDAGHPELAGWAALTRSLTAWYQGDPARSADAARRGQAETAEGTAAFVKLAAHEMRCAAMLGDTAGMEGARRRAAAAMGRLGPETGMPGAYSVPQAADPPYTATSLLVTGRHAEAAAMTRGILATVYGPPRTGRMAGNYARTLLILALAAAGLGDADEAAATGAAALGTGPVAWPTMVLARRLGESLAGQAPGSAHAAGFAARLAEARTRSALPPGGPRG